MPTMCWRMLPSKFSKIVGSLNISKLDLSYVVGLEIWSMQATCKPHLDCMRYILWYLRATVDYALLYATGIPLELYRYTDADWAGSIFGKQSTSNLMFSFGSVAMTWSSKKQPIVALLGIEAEYQGAAVAACEVSWLRKLLSNLGLHVDKEVVIYCDNINSIQLAKNPMYHAQTKHIEVDYHFIWERVLAGDIDLVYVSTRD